MGLQLRTQEGTIVDVPATFNAITTYVLVEQERWFEKELDFLLAFLKPEMTAIDIGANLGVYALPLAKRIHRVFAYEPGREARTHLETSRTLNAADNLEIVDKALSDTVREGRLIVSETSEVNRLAPDEGHEPGEPVAVTALDREDETRGWSPDIVKIDAEGEELNIIEGGRAFFTRHSPLVMFEVRIGKEVNLPAIDAFKALGYRIYRSLPAAAVLVPCETNELDATDGLDSYEINLFAAKPDRAAELKARGLLIDEARDWTPDDAAREAGLSLLKTRRFAAPFSNLHDRPIDRAYRDALAGYAAWRTSRDYGALRFAVAVLAELAQAQPSMARLSTLARIAFEAGKRDLAVKSLSIFQAQLKSGGRALDEPFWPASARFDDNEVNPRGWSDWFITQALDQAERLGWFSSCWGTSGVNLEWLAGHPWIGTEMLRRHVLTALCTRGSTAIPERLCRSAPDHLNASLWLSGRVAAMARRG